MTFSTLVGTFGAVTLFVICSGWLLIKAYHYEKKNKYTNKKISALKGIVDRIKLKDDTVTSIDDIVKFARESNIRHNLY